MSLLVNAMIWLLRGNSPVARIEGQHFPSLDGFHGGPMTDAGITVVDITDFPQLYVNYDVGPSALPWEDAE